MTVTLFALLIVGAPIGVALGLAGVVGLYSLGGMTDVAGILQQAPLSQLSHYELNTIKMLVAGLLPACFVIVVIVFTIWYLLWRNPSRAPKGRAYTWREKFVATSKVGPVLLLIVAVSAFLYFGIATPVETSALGA